MRTIFGNRAASPSSFLLDATRTVGLESIPCVFISLAHSLAWSPKRATSLDTNNVSLPCLGMRNRLNSC